VSKLQLSDDNIQLQERRQRIIADLQRLPELIRTVCDGFGSGEKKQCKAHSHVRLCNSP
jgi:hypothetical protein